MYQLIHHIILVSLLVATSIHVSAMESDPTPTSNNGQPKVSFQPKSLLRMCTDIVAKSLDKDPTWQTKFAQLNDEDLQQELEKVFEYRSQVIIKNTLQKLLWYIAKPCYPKIVPRKRMVKKDIDFWQKQKPTSEANNGEFSVKIINTPTTKDIQFTYDFNTTQVNLCVINHTHQPTATDSHNIKDYVAITDNPPLAWSHFAPAKQAYPQEYSSYVQVWDPYGNALSIFPTGYGCSDVALSDDHTKLIGLTANSPTEQIEWDITKLQQHYLNVWSIPLAALYKIHSLASAQKKIELRQYIQKFLPPKKKSTNQTEKQPRKRQKK